MQMKSIGALLAMKGSRPWNAMDPLSSLSSDDDEDSPSSDSEQEDKAEGNQKIKKASGQTTKGANSTAGMFINILYSYCILFQLWKERKPRQESLEYAKASNAFSWVIPGARTVNHESEIMQCDMMLWPLFPIATKQLPDSKPCHDFI